jgi:outer membrane protein assembly factor BamB
MNTPETTEPIPRKPLRLWPGVVAALLLIVVRFGLPLLLPQAKIFAVLGGLALALAILVWWIFFSRAPWRERVMALVLMIAGVFATSRLVHESISNGMMGLMLPIYASPILTLALVAWAAFSRNFAPVPRQVALVGMLLIASGFWTLLRTDGITGEGGAQLQWRWTQTAEERLLAQSRDEPMPRPSAPPKTTSDVAWPGFRGPDRDGVVRGVRIESDWAKSPPVELWRRAIGPGWSSFAVQGDLFYTQEQRGDEEVVACHKVSTGEPVWRHADPVRFWESNGGAGPRGTPTLSNGRVYTLGATGVLNVLEAADGKVIWSRNISTDSGVKVPGWGFSGSPLVINDFVIVPASGKLIAYDIATGKERWVGPARGGSYSSPHRITVEGVPQVLMLSGKGLVSVAPADGAVLWDHEWSGVPIVQPALAPNGDILISTGGGAGGLGVRRLAVKHGTGGWEVEERWTSKGLKPYYNDMVIHKDHAFGFDGSILACIELTEGKRKWKDGRFGHGQLMLVADQDLLLVLSEQGELALVSANVEEFKELGRIPAIRSKTWNHPALVGDTVLVRNGEEMAAFRLSTARR